MTMAGDPDIISDFIAPPNGTVDGNFFTYIHWLSLAQFPALNGQSVSYAVIEFPSGTTNPPHTHPRSAELLSLAYAGDLFVFPKGLLHFQYNADSQKPALATSAFGSANAGTVSIPSTLFPTVIHDSVLAISFKTDVATIQKLKASLATRP
ncbi:germin-like protein 9-2 [Pyrus ussuriensis x Pyrus communis]|uniref:Germin-like protein n=1 Tax=Pyrus ussuriensis x Pyrus communis TaxID=2448454 RepID=A0A5N5GJS7_9ROSA|nr:germin-like protein 9-2 [Pyrus ussuriensis x Pyrus communis]